MVQHRDVARTISRVYYFRAYSEIAQLLPKMAQHSNPDLTQLLQSWSKGDQQALEDLTPFVYRELHRLAAHYMGGEKQGHTLQTTALVNEAYVRLIDWKNVQWQNRAHFFAVSAQLMRHILVDFARAR